MGLVYLIAKLINRLQPTALKNCEIDKKAKVGYKSNFINTKVGKYTYFGNNNSVQDAEFGSFCSIASFCAIGGGEHPISFVSTSPVFYRGKNVFNKNFSNYKFENAKRTIIGNDVWIGENVFIKAGVVIGDGAIIGAHSVVTRDVPPYAIVAGCPATIIRFRFDEKVSKQLLESQWWNLDENILANCLNNTNSVEEFLDKIKK